MTSTTGITATTRREVVALIASGVSTRGASRRCGCSQSMAVLYARQAGLVLKTQRPHTSRKRRAVLASMARGMSSRDAAAKHKVSASSAQRWQREVR